MYTTKKILIALISLVGIGFADTSVEFSFMRDDDTYFSFDEESDIFSLSYSSFVFETGGEYEDGFFALCGYNSWDNNVGIGDSFNPNIQLRHGEDDYWTVNFSITNTGDDAILLTTLELEMLGKAYTDGGATLMNTPINVVTELSIDDEVQVKDTFLGYLEDRGMYVSIYHYIPVVTTYELPQVMLDAGESTIISLTLSNAEDKNNIYAGINKGSIGYEVYQSIPEPATTTLSLLALVGLATRRRR